MEARFWVRHWRKFFPKKEAKVFEQHALIRLMRELQKKEAKGHDRTTA